MATSGDCWSHDHIVCVVVEWLYVPAHRSQEEPHRHRKGSDALRGKGRRRFQGLLLILLILFILLHVSVDTDVRRWSSWSFLLATRPSIKQYLLCVLCTICMYYMWSILLCQVSDIVGHHSTCSTSSTLIVLIETCWRWSLGVSMCLYVYLILSVWVSLSASEPRCSIISVHFICLLIDFHI